MQKTVMLFVALAASLGGCAGSPMRYLGTAMGSPSAARAADASPQAAASTTPPTEAVDIPRLAGVAPRKLIYAGTFTVVTGDVVYAMDRTRALAEEMDGYLQKMSGNAIVIRVPAAKFHIAAARLADIGTVTHRDITAQDVTEQHVDLEIRLKNAQAMADRLRKLVEQAIDVKAALLVEQELTRVMTEIERLEGQLKGLESRVAYATLTVTFQPLRHAAPTPALEVKLPFLWLHGLGLDNLLNF